MTVRRRILLTHQRCQPARGVDRVRRCPRQPCPVPLGRLYQGAHVPYVVGVLCAASQQIPAAWCHCASNASASVGRCVRVASCDSAAGSVRSGGAAAGCSTSRAALASATRVRSKCQARASRLRIVAPSRGGGGLHRGRSRWVLVRCSRAPAKVRSRSCVALRSASCQLARWRWGSAAGYLDVCLGPPCC